MLKSYLQFNFILEFFFRLTNWSYRNLHWINFDVSRNVHHICWVICWYWPLCHCGITRSANSWSCHWTLIAWQIEWIEWMAAAPAAEKIVLCFLISKSDNWIIWKKILFMMLLLFSLAFNWCSLQFVIRALNVLCFILTTICAVRIDTL